MRVLNFTAQALGLTTAAVAAAVAVSPKTTTTSIQVEPTSTGIPAVQPIVPAKPYAGNVSLPIDYSNKYPGNFSNRYWVQDQYYKPGGPVFVYDCAEADGEWFLGHLTKNTTFFNQYLREFSGLGIIWEHRYYGDSLPFPISLNTTAEKMQFLTNENGLKDFVVFANQFQWKNFSVLPKEVPWIVVGSSYGGNRAAALRKLYPETVFAAYASAAAVQHRKDMSVYFDGIYKGMVHYGLENCTSYIHKAVKYVDVQLSRPSTAAGIKRQYLGRTAEKNSNAGFAKTFNVPYYSFHIDGVDQVLREFCDYMDAVKPPKGEENHGAFYSDRWAAWPPHAQLVSGYMDDSANYCEGTVRDNSKTPNCRLDTRLSHPTMISWKWQSCTQFGYFHPTNIGPRALSSSYNTLEYQQATCFHQFPDGRSSGLLPAEPRTKELNALTGGWNMSPSQVFWTTGEWDPWKALTVFSTEPGAPRVKVMDRPPRGCNSGEIPGKVFGYVMPNAEHSYDFYTGFAPAKKPTRMFAVALKQWLKCFSAAGQYRG